MPTPKNEGDTVKELEDAVKECTVDREADMFSYSGPIAPGSVGKFMQLALEHKQHKNLVLAITTYGGDAHSAYRLARFFQGFYHNIRVIIIGPCKSAGTLVCICANELAFGPFGELGPLDVQVTRKDEIIPIASGLDTFQALAIIRNYAFRAFEEYMVNIVESSLGAISTRTACEIASSLVTGLFQPLMAQIDPQRMGEMQRMMSVARAYGQRLGGHNLKENALRKLIEGYPAHPFIIDFKEASRLFKRVSKITPAEALALNALDDKGACLDEPADDIVFADVSELATEGTKEGEDEATGGSAGSLGSDDQGVPSNSVETAKAANESTAGLAARPRRKPPG
jgi:hypothetical protein